MAARRFSSFKEKKIDPSPARPNPGVGSSPQKKFDSEAANPWAKAPGAKSFDFNSKTNFPRVKDAVNKD